MDYNTNKQAFFNAAMGSVIRLDTALNYAVECRYLGEYTKWVEYLRTIRAECVPKWDDGVREESMKKINKVIPKLVIYGRIKNNGGNPPAQVVQEVYQGLMDAEEYIRINADKVGLLNPNKADIMSGLGDVD
jgi:hypothetical protein